MTEQPLPTNVNVGTVKGMFVTAQRGAGGSPVTVPIVGTVTFTATPKALLDAGSVPPQTILPLPVTVTLDASGAFTVDLVATDDPDLNPVGWNYKVSFQLTGVKYDPFNIDLPQGTTVDLAVVAPVASSGGVLITRGVGVPDTSAASAGDVLTWDGTVTEWAAPTGGGATVLDGLTDVDTTGVTDGQALVYDAATTSWHAATVSGGGTVTSADITDASTVGKAVLTAADAPTARTALGAGTSSLALGATSGTAKAGDYQPAAANITDSTVTGRAVLTAADAAAGRTALGAGTSNLALGTTAGTALAGDTALVPPTRTVNGHPLSANVTVTAADAGAATTAQGALADTAVQPADLATIATTGALPDATGLGTLPQLPAGSTLTVVSVAGGWPARPTARTDVYVRWLDVAALGTDPAGAIDGDTKVA